MLGWKLWLRCVAEAVCSRGQAALNGRLPFAAVAPDVSADALARLVALLANDATVALQQAAAIEPSEVEQAAAEVANEVGAKLDDAQRETLTRYLAQVPATVRAVLRRPSEPEGVTAPGGWTPQQGPPLTPTRVSRFRPGERPLPGLPLELVELLGVGGFGEVWKARNIAVRNLPPVALKFCLDPVTRERLERHEAELAALVGQVQAQPGPDRVVTLRSAYLGCDPSCLEYEYIAGGDLAGLLGEWKRDGQPWQERATEAVRRLARVVGALHRHARPVVHRDLKPSNVLVQRLPDGGYALRVADFGIGGIASERALDRERTGETSPGEHWTAAILGACTPLYASPQQREGGRADPRDDVHALGVIWFQMLVGDVRRGISVDFAEDLGERGVSQSVVSLVKACVTSNVDRRLRDASTLADAIAALPAHGSPSSIPTDSKSQEQTLLERVTAALSQPANPAMLADFRQAHQLAPERGDIRLGLTRLLLTVAETALRQCNLGDARAMWEELATVNPAHQAVQQLPERIRRQGRTMREMTFYLLVLDEVRQRPRLAEAVGFAFLDSLSDRMCGLTVDEAVRRLDVGPPVVWDVSAWLEPTTPWPTVRLQKLESSHVGTAEVSVIDYQVRCRQALGEMLNRKTDSADFALSWAVAEYPEWPTARHYLGLMLGAQSKLEAAARELSAAIESAEGPALPRIERALRLLD